MNIEAGDVVIYDGKEWEVKTEPTDYFFCKAVNLKRREGEKEIHVSFIPVSRTRKVDNSNPLRKWDDGTII